MINAERFQNVLDAYKKAFIIHWPDECYKWQAIKHFQDCWDVDADDFASMLSAALSKTANLLASANNFPARMITEFAQAAPDKTRNAFMQLFDESQDVCARIEQFKHEADELLNLIGKSDKSHYQDERTITTYLWLRYPDKYTLYKLSFVRQFAEEIGANYTFKKGDYQNNIRNCFAFYDEVCDLLLKDEELRQIVSSQLTDDCWPDKQFHTVAIDVGFYIHSYYQDDIEESGDRGYWFLNASPKQWSIASMPVGEEQSYTLINENGHKRRIYQNFLKAKAGDLVVGYESSPVKKIVALAEVSKEQDGEKLYFRKLEDVVTPIDFTLLKSCPQLQKMEYFSMQQGSLFKLRKKEYEFILALIRGDIDVSEYTDADSESVANPDKREAGGAALADDDVESVHYWLYAPGAGASKWDEFYTASIMGIGWEEIGDLRAFGSKEELRQRMMEVFDNESSMKNSAHATWQFCHDLRVGDIVFAKKGVNDIIGRGVVVSDYEFDETRQDFNHVRKVDWTHKGNWHFDSSLAQKTLTDITPYTELVTNLKALFDNEDQEVDDEPERIITYPPYTKANFLADVFMSEEAYDQLVGALMVKKNIILQGAPGVGKTFAAKRLAYSIMGCKDADRVAMVQFHQSYSYEDFIMGFRPTATGFELRKGVFYHFCKKAEVDLDNPYFFIIDEINRGNLSKIFGELFMLIENDKRGIPLQLLYSDEKFAVPENVYIIGMMNTADRSLAMLDYALRRRFAFATMHPGFETEGFRAYRAGLANSKLDRLIDCIISLNDAITCDETLGSGFCIGHSYFCNLTGEQLTDQRLSAMIEYEIIPMLNEYWFDEPAKVRTWSEQLRSAIK